MPSTRRRHSAPSLRSLPESVNVVEGSKMKNKFKTFDEQMLELSSPRSKLVKFITSEAESCCANFQR